MRRRVRQTATRRQTLTGEPSRIRQGISSIGDDHRVGLRPLCSALCRSLPNGETRRAVQPSAFQQRHAHPRALGDRAANRRDFCRNRCARTVENSRRGLRAFRRAKRPVFREGRGAVRRFQGEVSERPAVFAQLPCRAFVAKDRRTLSRRDTGRLPRRREASPYRCKARTYTDFPALKRTDLLFCPSGP